jgi:hypothetical protein
MQIEPGTSPKHRYELIKATLLVIIGALITITVVYGIDYFSPKSAPTTVDVVEPVSQTDPVVDDVDTINQETTTEKVYSQEELNQIFEMDKKSPDTKLFYSERLGVGFTYAPYNPTFEEGMSSEGLSLTTVKEIGNKIYLTDGSKEADANPSGYGNSLEVFTKNPNDPLDKAIAKEFLVGANPKDCFVSVKKYSPLYRGYISYIPDKTKLNDDNVYLGGEVNCPSKAMPYIGNEGSSSFFILNEKDFNTTKYGFLSIGSGGQSANAGYKDNKNMPWIETIRFLK